MNTILLFTIQLFAIFGGVALYSWGVHRRLGGKWKWWGLGAAAFVLSQVVRLPLLALLTVLLNPIAAQWNQTQIFWSNFLVLVFTAALFEEGARFILLKWFGKTANTWSDGVMFGAGHGGIEAILLVGLSALSNIVLLAQVATGGIGSLVDPVAAVDPAQGELLRSQIELLQNAPAWLVFVAIWERVLAILLHTAASLLVLKSVRSGQASYWLAAFALHFFGNAVVVVALQYGKGLISGDNQGYIISEVVLTLFSIISLLIVRAMRHRMPAESPTIPTELGVTTQVPL